MNLIINIILLLLTKLALAIAPPIEIVFLIQSQDTKYQNELSRNLKENLIRQSFELQPKYRIKVHVLHEILNYPGGWTIHNLIPQLMMFQQMRHMDKHNMNENANEQIELEMDKQKERDTIINENIRWIVFCEETTKVNVKLLIEKLNNENYTQPLYLGYPLYDREPTIIHHFAFFENPKWFPYPMLRAGIVLSWPLFKRIADCYKNYNSNASKRFQHATAILQRSEFSIDAAHELARFIYDNIQIPTSYTTTTITSPLTKNRNNKNYNENVKSHKNGVKASATESSSQIIFNAKDFKTDLSNSDKYIADISKSKTGGKTETINTVIKKQKILLRKASYICSGVAKDARNGNGNNETTCAMYAQQASETPSPRITCTPVESEEIYFAVKTCVKYQRERLPIIQSTWAPYAKHVKYFSNVQDDTIPTINTGIPNVEIGHCEKTLKILKLALKDIEHYNENNKNYNQQQPHLKIKWLFLTDDDTVISVSGVCQVLGCYNSNDEIYLGERYGYRLYAKDGFNYITGGGGIAFTLPVVKLILQQCSCPSPSAPDDMIIGSCLHSLQIKALHSSRFHQARPNDYPVELLKLEPPVSFHKFWQLDPLEVYKTWFRTQDQQVLNSKRAQEKLLTENTLLGESEGLAKPESFNFNEIPFSFVASLHHSKERHVDL